MSCFLLSFSFIKLVQPVLLTFNPVSNACATFSAINSSVSPNTFLRSEWPRITQEILLSRSIEGLISPVNAPLATLYVFCALTLTLLGMTDAMYVRYIEGTPTTTSANHQSSIFRVTAIRTEIKGWVKHRGMLHKHIPIRYHLSDSPMNLDFHPSQ